jgi:hypothetical protein
MVDCQSNTRHLLSWLMDRLDPDKATLFLAVGRAVDQGTGMVRAAQTETHTAHARKRTHADR